MAWTYKLRYVRCGRKGCTVCREQPAHGPYWYGYEHRGGRVYTRYVGKLPPDVEFAKDAPRSSVDPRWVFKGKMDMRTALRILAFNAWPEQRVLRKRWRELVSIHHPDIGGDTRVCAAINAAYEYLKK